MKTIALLILLCLPGAAAAQNEAASTGIITAASANKRLLSAYLAVNNAYLITSPEARDFCGTFATYGKTRRQEYFLEWYYRTPFILRQARELQDTLQLLDNSIRTYNLHEASSLAPILTEITEGNWLDEMREIGSHKRHCNSRLIAEAGISSAAVATTILKQKVAMITVMHSVVLAQKAMVTIIGGMRQNTYWEASAKANKVLGGRTPDEAIREILSVKLPGTSPIAPAANPASVERIKQILAERRLRNK